VLAAANEYHRAGYYLLRAKIDHNPRVADLSFTMITSGLTDISALPIATIWHIPRLYDSMQIPSSTKRF
jgi:hypothetical protein